MEDKKFNFDKLYAVDSETEYYSNLSVEELKAKLVKINEEKEKIVKYLYIKENTNIRYTVTPQDTLFLYDKIEVKTEQLWKIKRNSALNSQKQMALN